MDHLPIRITFLVGLLLAVPANAEQDPNSGKYAPDFIPPVTHSRERLIEEFRWSSDAVLNPEVVSHSRAKWIQLHFDDSTELGELGSIKITSTADGHSQTLDATTLAQWGHSSAFFNGETVSVSVNAPPGQMNVLVVIREVSVGIPAALDRLNLAESNVPFCNTDNRVTSKNPAVGRIATKTCTGWIISNGAHLTAGHCGGSSMEQLHFQVPLSDPDGTINISDTQDQYAIDVDSIIPVNDDPVGDAGQDWAVFGVHPNTETNLLPVERQKSFYRLTDRANPAELGLIGYGYDDDPANTAPPFEQNQHSSTQQRTPQGRFIQEFIEGDLGDDVKLTYWAFSTGGSSGSPLEEAGLMLAIGIHTNRCISGVSAAGTGFKNKALAKAIMQFPGPKAIYVDNGHPEVLEDGSIFRPYDTLAEGLEAVPDGGVLSVVTGTYSLESDIVIDKNFTLSTPVGPITITVP